jgi:hypothetical protein
MSRLDPLKMWLLEADVPFMKTLPSKTPGLIGLLLALVFAGLVSASPGTAENGTPGTAKTDPAARAERGGTSKQKKGPEPGKLLSAALRARGGTAALKSLKDDYSLVRIRYGDVYKTEILYRTWTMEPCCFRQDMLRDGVILKSQQYDGKHFVEGYGRRVRFGLEKDLRTLLENVELNKIFSLLPIGTDAYPARLGGRIRQEGRWLQEVFVEAPSGLTYRIFFDEDTALISWLEYLERNQYGQSEDTHPVTTYIDSYRGVDGVRVADRLRICSRGELKAEVQLVEQRFNLGLTQDFFSVDRLRQSMAENPVGNRRVTTPTTPQQEWKATAYRKIAERLETHRDCRFREVVSYGDPGMYRERLFDPDLTFVVDPEYLKNDDALAFYAELLPAPAGFYEDCIVLAQPPENPSVSADLLLHETTHALLRRRQEQAPLVTADDEYLMDYQAGLFSLGRLLESFERITLDKTEPAEPGLADRATGTWRAVRRNLEQNLENSRMTPEALEQFRQWCGVDFDLNRIRGHYLALGVNPKWMPMEPKRAAE